MLFFLDPQTRPQDKFQYKNSLLTLSQRCVKDTFYKRHLNTMGLFYNYEQSSIIHYDEWLCPENLKIIMG